MWAERICFLGFGFDHLNMKRLDLKTVMEHRGANLPTIYASVLGRTSQENHFARTTLGCVAGIWAECNNEKLMALREFGLLLP